MSTPVPHPVTFADDLVAREHTIAILQARAVHAHARIRVGQRTSTLTRREQDGLLSDIVNWLIQIDALKQAGQ